MSLVFIFSVVVGCWLFVRNKNRQKYLCVCSCISFIKIFARSHYISNVFFVVVVVRSHYYFEISMPWPSVIPSIKIHFLLSKSGI